MTNTYVSQEIKNFIVSKSMALFASQVARITFLFIIVLVIMAAISVVLYIFGPGVWAAVAVIGASAVVIAAYVVIIRTRKNRLANDEETGLEDEGLEDDLGQISGLPLRFTFLQLKLATRNFENRLGNGSFGTVFEGTLENGRKIAVKRLESLGQGKKEFLAEVNTVGSIHHLNLVTLIGFCAESRHRMLVYEFMCNGSLEKWIFRDENALDWQTRKSIMIGIAKGLAYLHEECTRKIVHLDIKPQNILLDANLQAKISDFGMSTLIERDQSQIMTAIRGTFGYMAPELLSSIITKKADVYSFGIVVMEIVCGRKNIDRSVPEDYMFLLLTFMRKAKDGQLGDLVDKKCELQKLEVVEMMKVAVWCLQNDYTARPSMSSVVRVLESDMKVEAELDYSINYPPTSMAIQRKDKEDFRSADSATALLPWSLSGPR
ncbi:G-type lectin S-receptor-like serine/threonine-protein kinase SD2-5 [Mercurialis annua]|uniref:G-type lectin S-receptor-like serine/threonine-protein kinase SD2-5 n=1 Tax=Mercurialis annua TaxID=3986 RepID=UPI002160FD6D|nr:G-type lectin S-receptor-like serine/threonine-protein kinase SD2-5 [Mercurialis annua]